MKIIVYSLRVPYCQNGQTRVTAPNVIIQDIAFEVWHEEQSYSTSIHGLTYPSFRGPTHIDGSIVLHVQDTFDDTGPIDIQLTIRVNNRHLTAKLVGLYLTEYTRTDTKIDGKFQACTWENWKEIIGTESTKT